MLARIFLFINCFAILALSSAHAATYLESGGKVVIEAESVAAKGSWSKESSIGGAKGSGYLIWKGPDLFSGANAGRDTLSYTFRIQKAGNYELRWRSYIGHGNNVTESNDSWVRFPSGKNIPGQHALNGWTKAYQNSSKQWSWAAATVDHVGKPIKQYFSKGDHVIQISGRSFGHAIDRIVLFNYGELSFSQNAFDSFNVSSTVGGSQPPEPTSPPAPEPVTPVAPTPVAPAPVAPTPVAPTPVAPTPVTPAPVAPAPPPQAQAPSVSVEGTTLSWNSVDALTINIHGQYGEWIQSISGSSTKWTAPRNGQYFVVATNQEGWEQWGRSNTVEVTSIADSADASSIVDLSSLVYSTTAGELFWSVNGSAENTIFEVRRDDSLVFTGSARSYFDNQLSPGNNYRYTLKAISNGQVLDEKEVNLKTNAGDSWTASATVNSALTELRGEVYSQSAVELHWEHGAQVDGETLTYNLYQDGQLISQSSAQSYFVDGLSAGQTYRFTLRTLDNNGVESEGYNIMLSTYAADGSSFVSFGKPSQPFSLELSSAWDKLPLSTQQSLPSDCLLSDVSNDIVYCYSAGDDRLMARTISDNQSVWSYSLNRNQRVELLDVINADRLMLVAASDTCVSCASYDLTLLKMNGATASNSTVFVGEQGKTAYNVNNLGLRSSFSANGESIFIAANQFSAMDGLELDRVESWFATGVGVVEVDIATGSVIDSRKVDDADIYSVDFSN